VTGKSGPTDRQILFLNAVEFEVLYGGAAGGGKSDALLMAALQYVDVPGYNAIIFRRSYSDLNKPGALISRSHEWLDGSPARWDGVNHTWTFPSGARLVFGFLENDRDVYHHQSAEYQFIGFDELTQFTEFQYTYLLSRLRRLQAVYVPLRVRSASNPGGVGHEWVFQRFVAHQCLNSNCQAVYDHPVTTCSKCGGPIQAPSRSRVFIPARLVDNPYLDQENYLKALANLPPLQRKQLLDGVWVASVNGGFFKPEWFRYVYPETVPKNTARIRVWDLAATAPTANKDPDYAVGLLATAHKGQLYIIDVVRRRGTPKQVEDLISLTAERDGPQVEVFLEIEGGSSGKISFDYYVREVLRGYTVRGEHPTGDKETRAAPVASLAESGNVFLVRGYWNSDYLNELEAFPAGAHDDQVDTTSLAYAKLIQKRRALGLISFGKID